MTFIGVLLFLEIFAISRNIELPENIGYLGPQGSFTHQAAEARFGAMSSHVSVSSIKGIFKDDYDEMLIDINNKWEENKI